MVASLVAAEVVTAEVLQLQMAEMIGPLAVEANGLMAAMVKQLVVVVDLLEVMDLLAMVALVMAASAVCHLELRHN